MRRVLAPLALLLLAAAWPRPSVAQTILVDRIVARVNDRMVTLNDFERNLADKRQAVLADQSLDDAHRQEALDTLGRATLSEMYEELLLLSRADQLNARVTEADVEKALQQTRERMGLKTDQQYQQALQSSGMNEEMLRDRLRRNLLVQEVMGREVQPRLKIGEEDLRRYYNEHGDQFSEPESIELQDVVIIADSGDSPAVQSTAQKVHSLLTRGTAPEDVAKTLTGDGVTVRVVDLGWVQKGDLDPDLDRAAWSLQNGQVTAVVQGRGGLHVVKQLDHRPAHVRPFDEVKGDIQGRLEQERMGGEYRKYLRELEQRSYITLTLPPEAEGFKGLGEGGEESPFGEGLGEVPAPAPVEKGKEPATAPKGAPPAGAPVSVPNGKPAPESPTGAPPAVPVPAPAPSPAPEAQPTPPPPPPPSGR